ncbi:MAG: hypothetical protein KC613_20595, partial [Myxococcales bacterium]|nr:hypothetical protein [Myxococcales bacterium]
MRLWLLLGLCAASLPGCDSSADPGPDPARAQLALALSHAVEQVIVPAVQAFDAETAALAAALPAFCAAPDVAGLTGLQGGWRQLALRWQAVAPLRFGPLQDDLVFPTLNFIESMRARGEDYTEAVREGLATALASDAPLDAAFVEGLTFDRVGLLALEVLLFEGTTAEHPTAPEAVLADFQANPRKCAYLQAMADHLAGKAAGVAAGWTVRFGAGDAFAVQMGHERLDDGASPAATLIIALAEHLDYVRRRKLEGTPDARLSGGFFPQQRALLATCRAFLEGADPAAVGFLDALDALGLTETAAPIRAALVQAENAAEAEERSALAEALAAL